MNSNRERVQEYAGRVWMVAMMLALTLSLVSIEVLTSGAAAAARQVNDWSWAAWYVGIAAGVVWLWASGVLVRLKRTAR